MKSCTTRSVVKLLRRSIIRRTAHTLIAGAMLLTSHSASATDHTWILGGTGTTGGGTGNFETAGNWNPTTIPGAGDNTFVSNGGTVLIGPGGQGTYNTFDCNAGTVANGSGTYTMTGASTTLNVNSWFRYGTSSGATGTFNLNGGTLNTSASQVNSNINIGETAGAFGNLNISNGAIFNANNSALLRIGNSGTGTLTMTSGAFNMNSTGFSSFGLNTGSKGTVTISGGTFSNLKNADINVGDSGTGILTVTGAGIFNSGTGTNFYLARQAVSNGTINLGNFTTSSALGGTIQTVGINGALGTKTINFDGGTLQALVAGNLDNTTSNVLKGGLIADTQAFNSTLTGALVHGASVTGADGGLTKNGAGTLTLTGANTYTGATTINNGTLQIGNGTTDGSIATTSGVLINSGTLAYNFVANRSVGYVISGAGGVTINDTGATKGTVSLTNANAYTGATTVTSGNLTLDHSGANTGALGNTAVSVGGGTTLLVKGSTIIGTPAAGPSLALTGGATPATQGTLNLQDLTVNTLGLAGNLALGSGGSGAILNFDLGTTSGSNDALNVGGIVTPSGTTTINLNALGSIVSGTSTYTLINATGGLTAGGGDFVLGTKPAGFNQYSLASTTANAAILTINANPTVVGNEYWTGTASRNNGDSTNAWGFGSGLAVPQSNWSTDLAGTNDPLQVPGATTDVIFTATNATGATPGGATNTLTTQLDGAYNIHSLTFDVPAATTITSTVVNTNGNTLTIGPSGLTLAASSTSDSTISNTGAAGGVALNGNQTWANNSATLPLTVSAGITGNATTGNTNTLTFAGSGAAATNVSGVIGNGAQGGNLGLVVSKTGNGILTLNAVNTFTGGITLNSGIVQVGVTGALNANVVTFGAGSTADLRLNGNNATVGGLNTNATVGTPVVENTNAAANATLTDTVAAGTANYAAVVQDGDTGTLAFTKAGAGTQVMSGANTYTGGTTVSGGTLTAGSTSALGAATNVTTLTGGLLDLNGNAITQSSLALNGGLEGATGGGILSLPSTGNAITIGGTYLFATPAITGSIALTGATGGNIVKTTGNGNPVFSGGLDLGGQTRTIVLQDTGGDAAPELTLSGVISNGGITQDNSAGASGYATWGTLSLAGNNTYDGVTTIANGRLEITNNNSLGSTVGNTVVGPSGTLAFFGSGQTTGTGIAVPESLTLGHTATTTYGLDAVQNNSGANTLNGAVTLATNSQFNVNTGSLTLANVVSDGGGGFGVIKTGATTLALNAANTYTGVTTITGGILSANTLANGGVVSSIGASTNAPGNLVFNGGTLQYTGAADVTTDRGYTVTGASTLDTGAANITFTGQILATGTTGSFSKIGTGTVMYTNNASANTFDSGTGYPGYTTNQGQTVFGTPGLSASGQVNNIGGELNTGATGQIGNVATTINGGTTNVGTYVGVGRGNSTTGQTAVLTLNNDAVLKSANASMGYANGLAGYNSAPTFTLNNASSYTDAGVFRLAESNGSTATLNVNNTATVNLTGTGATNRLYVGDGGIGNVFQTGGVVAAANTIILGNVATGGGTYNLGGGTLTTAGVVKGLGTGTFNFNGGTLQDVAANTAANNTAFMTGLTTTNVQNGGAVIDTNGNSATIAQALNHSAIAGDNATDGGLTKTGAGTLTVSGGNTYTGVTTVNGGTLALQSANPDVVTAAIVVNGAGTTNVASATQGVLQLAQNNELPDSAPVTLNGGTLNTQGFNEGAAGAPGMGTLTVNGTFSFLDYSSGNANGLTGFTGNSAPSTLAFSASGSQAWTGQLEVVNYEYGAALGSGATSTLDSLFIGTSNSGDSLTAAQLSQITFVNPNGSGNNYLASQLSNGEVVPGQIAPTPEPGSLIPIIVGMAGLGVLIARRRKANAKDCQNEFAEAV